MKTQPAGDLDLAQFQGVFFEEATEHLAEMESLLVRMDLAAPVRESLDAVFRAAHSIKGGSGMFGFTDMTTLTHELESLLDRVRKGELALTAIMVDVLLKSSDLLREQLAFYGGHAGAPSVGVDEMCARIRACQSSLSTPLPGSVRQGAPAQCAPPPVRTLVIEVPAGKGDPAMPDDLIEQLRALGTLTENTLPVAGRRKPKTRRYALETAESADVVLTLFEFVMDSSKVRIEEASAPAPREAGGADATSAMAPASLHTHRDASVAACVVARDDASAAKSEPRPPDRSPSDTSIRVSVDKVDQLINQVGELVITQAMLAQSVVALDPVLHEKLVAGMAELERNTRDLQQSVMSIRMLPIAFVFNRFPRLVRDLAAKLGKQVELVTHGEATELDKGLIERISDPLTHLVRNSIDHGIETPDVREAAGKPLLGMVSLRAAHAGGNILIEVSDDGAGLDRARILAKARERGLAVHDGMSDAEVWALIFEPGFSTAQAVTDVSGRGVGMDVVRRNIAALSGSVEIESVRGAGTRITVRLPLTLAIMDGMSVAVGGEVYILPLSGIVESLQVGEGQVRSITGRGLVIDVRGEYLPVLSMHEFFVNGPALRERASGTMVIVEADGAKVALLVDELLGQHQVVVKSLEANYRKVPGISGATIMGDGRVALILDIASLTRGRRQGASRAAQSD